MTHETDDLFAEQMPPIDAPSASAPTLPIQRATDNNLVNKANSLLNGRYKLPASEIKLINACVSCLNPQQQYSFQDIVIPIPKLSEMTGLSPSYLYSDLKNIAKSLHERVIEIETTSLESGKKGWKLYNWISRSEFDPDRKTYIMQFHPHLVPYLLQLNDGNYTKWKLIWQRDLDSEYALRLFELLWQVFPFQKTRTFELKELKRTLGLTTEKKGKLVEKYKRFPDFEKSVLQVAKEQINANTGICIDYEKIKEGRSYRWLKFSIERNQSFKTVVGDDKPISELLGGYGIKAEHVDALIENFGEERVRSNIEYTKREEARGTVNKPTHFLLKAIEKDYAGTPQELNPNNYPEGPQRDFVKERILPSWQYLDENKRAEFIQNGLLRGFFADEFEKYRQETGKKSITDIIFDAVRDNDTSWG